MRRKWHIKLYNTRSTRRAAEIWMICCCIRILASNNHSCIVIHIFFGIRCFASLRAMCCICDKFCRFFYCLKWFDTVEFNRLPCPNNNMYDDTVFADKFRYQLTMFRNRVLIRLSRLLHDHIAFEIDASKLISSFFRIFYYLHDLILLNSIVCHVQRARCTMMWFSMIDSAIIWFMFEVCILIGLFRLLDTYIAYVIAI